MPSVKDVMTRDLHVIPANATLQEAAKWMHEHGCGMLPVTENGQVLGTITDRDIVVRSVAEGDYPGKTPVSKAMTAAIHHVGEDADVMEAAKLMEEKQIRRLLVTDAENRPVGVVSLGDLAVGSKDKVLVGEALREISRSS